MLFRESSVRTLFALFGVLSVSMLGACALFNPPPRLTEAQLEQLQSYQFEADKSLVFKSTLFVLQGLGYSVDARDEDTGLITAKSLTSQRQAADDCTYNTNPLTHKSERYCRPGERYQVYRRLSVSLDRIGPKTHMRLSIIAVNSYYGDRVVTDQNPYQAIVARIEDRLFIRENIE